MEDCKNSVEFTEPENKIRKKWLFWSTLLPAFLIAGIAIFAITRLFINADFTPIMEILLFLLLSTSALYMNYYCAYKNPGTILLLLILIGNSLNLIVTFFNLQNLVSMKASLVFLLFMLAILAFEIAVSYYSYKLLIINKKMKERKLTASPLYINALSVFSTATNLEELNEQFSRLKTSNDSGSAVEILAKAYGQQKKMLTLAIE